MDFFEQFGKTKEKPVENASATENTQNWPESDPSNILVLGHAVTPAQIAHKVAKHAANGGIEQLVCIVRAKGGRIIPAWDETVDLPSLCEMSRAFNIEVDSAMCREHHPEDEEDDD